MKWNLTCNGWLHIHCCSIHPPILSWQLLHWGSHGGCTCYLSAESQILVAAAAAEVVAAVQVVWDHQETLHLQSPQEVDLIPNAGRCEVGSCDVMEAPENILKSLFNGYLDWLIFIYVLVSGISVALHTKSAYNLLNIYLRMMIHFSLDIRFINRALFPKFTDSTTFKDKTKIWIWMHVSSTYNSQTSIPLPAPLFPQNSMS